MTYQVIHTTYGLAKLAQAEASGIPLNLTTMAVGDGGGVEPDPTLAQTTLVNERYRAAINRLYVDPANPSALFVEMVVPAAVGGWYVREFGIFDDAGGLVSVGNFPTTFKTVPAGGATSDLSIRVKIVVSNASVVNLIVDPSVAVATQSWVLNLLAGGSLIPGGTTGQVLSKVTNVSGDYDWRDAPTQDMVVSVIQELQSVATDGQVAFNLSTVTTNGLAVIVEGATLPNRTGPGGWQQGSSVAQVVLGSPYPVGTEVEFRQNNPVGSVSMPLDAASNLSDLDDAASARANLDVFSKEEAYELQPAGNVAFTARSTPPPGWLVRNGAAVSRSTFSRLFSAIGITYGPGNGVSTFNLPPDPGGDFLPIIKY